MSKPRLLDLFCGAGGAAMGYHRAGFEVVGVDIKPQKHYPFEFHQADALTYPLDGFDAYHASPPCQDFIPTVLKKHGTAHCLPDISRRLIQAGKPYVIENIPGSPLRSDFKLCGCMFGLPRLRRQRWFETSWNALELRPSCQHLEHPISVTGHGVPSSNYYRDKLKFGEYIILARKAMDIDWMNRSELSQAIPPAYTEYIGKYLMQAVSGQNRLSDSQLLAIGAYHVRTPALTA